ncbi:hypothetical protein Hbal_1526 [Hirschia baltica ATCC 49814]|uniref:Uncharacterized protein n=1 Tax=Hirschia baltica (strain ATCC 49814 / DSM 5838 / IFAM 1418) TaxID=582402 RepID=C6XJB9_HIRBI|nr:hypothetical protein Hbal_1526 [Hirschia baltica ATCC 49814]
MVENFTFIANSSLLEQLYVIGQQIHFETVDGR